MLTTDAPSPWCRYWPRATVEQSADLSARFEFLGWLLASTIVNRAQVSVRLPRPLFALLMASSVATAPSAAAVAASLPGSPQQRQHQNRLRTLQGSGDGSGDQGSDPWGPLHPAVHHLAELDAELLGTVASIRGLDDEGFAAVLEADELDASMSRDAYIARMVHQVLVGSIEWQIEAMRRGFRGALGSAGRAALAAVRMSANDMRTLVCGQDEGGKRDFDVRKVGAAGCGIGEGGAVTQRVVIRCSVSRWVPT